MAQGNRLGRESPITSLDQDAERETRPSQIRREGNDDDGTEEVVPGVGLKNENRTGACLLRALHRIESREPDLAAPHASSADLSNRPYSAIFSSARAASSPASSS